MLSAWFSRLSVYTSSGTTMMYYLLFAFYIHDSYYFDLHGNTLQSHYYNKPQRFSMRHPLPWAWLANILPEDRWRPFRRLDAAWNRSGYLHKTTQRNGTTNMSLLILHLHMPLMTLMQPVFLFYGDQIVDWNLPSCVFTNLFLCHWVWIMGGMAMARRCQNTTTSTEAGDPCTLVMTSGWEFIGVQCQGPEI